MTEANNRTERSGQAAPTGLSEAFLRNFSRRLPTFRSTCAPETLERGKRLFQGGGVALERFDSKGVSGTVIEDGNAFHPSVILGGTWKSSCDCDAWGTRDDHCRHVAALVDQAEWKKHQLTGCAPFIAMGPDPDETAPEAASLAQKDAIDRRSVIEMANAREWLGLTRQAHSFRYDISLKPDLCLTILRLDDSGALATASAKPVKVSLYVNGSSLSPADRKVFSLAAACRERDEEGAYHFSTGEAGALVQALSGRYVRYRGRPVEFSAEDVRITADVGVHEDKRSISLRLATQDGPVALSAVEFVSEQPVYALFGGAIAPVRTDASLSHLKRWKAHSTLTIPRGDESAATTAMGALAALGVSFGGDAGAVQAEPPRFSLTLDGDAESVRAFLSVRYGDAQFTLSRAEARDHVTLDGRIIRRDEEAEKAAIQALVRAGLSRDGQSFAARGDRAIDVWSQGIPSLPSDWTYFGPKPQEVARVRTLAPRLAVSVSKNSWFELDIAFADGDASIDLAAIRNLIAAGRRYVRLSDGSMGELPKALTDHIRRILESTGKEPEGGVLALEPYEAGEVARLAEQVPDAKIPPSAQNLLEALTGKASLDPVPLPKGLNAELRSYQKSGFDWLVFLYNCGMGGILADDMGLGKTVQALAFLQWLKESGGAKRRPHLVIAPTSVITNWKREAARFTPGLSTLVYEGGDRADLLDAFDGHDLVLTSYAIVRRDGEALKKKRFVCVFLDEAQHVKNPGSMGAKAVSALQSDRRFALTGTPVENRLSDLWSIFHLLMPGFLGSESFFRNSYARPIEADGNVEVKERLRSRIRPFILRRLKEEVARDLPVRTDSVVPVPLSPGQQALYKDMLQVARRRVETIVSKVGIERAHISILSELTRLRQVCNDPRLLKLPPGTALPPSAKLEAFAELVHNLIDEGHRALVFSQFTEMLAILTQWADQEGIAYEYLDGSTKNRQERIDRFNAVDGPPLFFISLKAGGTGLNLTYADYVILYDPWWNPAVEEQAIDRAHRIGQDKPVFSYRLITQGTVEQKIAAMQARKRRLADSVVTSDEDTCKRLTTQDLADLFSEDF